MQRTNSMEVQGVEERVLKACNPTQQKQHARHVCKLRAKATCTPRVQTQGSARQPRHNTDRQKKYRSSQQAQPTSAETQKDQPENKQRQQHTAHSTAHNTQNKRDKRACTHLSPSPHKFLFLDIFVPFPSLALATAVTSSGTRL